MKLFSNILVILIFLYLNSWDLMGQEFRNEIEKIQNKENLSDVKVNLWDATKITKHYLAEIIKQLQTNDFENFKKLSQIEEAYFFEDTLYLYQLTEWEILLLLQGEYAKFFESIQNLKVIFIDDFRIRDLNNYTTHYLSNSIDFKYYLSEYIDKNLDSLAEQINNSSLSYKEKQFMNLYLDYFIYEYKPCDEVLKENVLKNARDFEEKYKNSYLANFSEKIISLNYTNSGFGYGGSINTGLTIPAYELKNFFSPSIPILLNLDFFYRNFILTFGLGPSIGQNIKNEYFSDTTWRINDKSSISMGEISLGYNLYENKVLIVQPKIGLRRLGLFPPNDELYYKNVSNITSNNNVFIGINFNFKWDEYSCKYNSLVIGRKLANNKSYKVIKIGFSYQNPRFERVIYELKGPIFMINLGIGVYQFLPKRVK